MKTLDLTAAWRLSTPAAAASGPGLTVALLPASPRLPTLVRERETTTLVTVDGTVVHRDRFTLDRAGTALDLTLPAGAVLWSAKVGEQTVRPVARGGVLSVPLGFATVGRPPVVEVVSVLERTIPKGRSELGLALPQVAAPVVEHQWRLLLPEGARYRWKSGDLRPAHERPRTAVMPPSAVEETVRVTAESPPLLDQKQVAREEAERQRDEERRKKDAAATADFDAFQEQAQQLKQGLVGGVKPLPVAIPESGKVLLLSGALPPARVAVELEIKGK